MRVLFLNSCVNGGGAGRSLENYFKHMDSHIEAHIVLPEKGVLGEVFEQKARVWVIPEFVERIHRSAYQMPKIFDRRWIHVMTNCYALLVAMSKISKLVKNIQPDVIYCNHMLANPVGAFVGWKNHIPVIFHARNIHVAWFGRLFYSFLARRDDVKRIICNSNASSKLFQAIVPSKVKVIYNFLDLEKFNLSQISSKLRKTYKVPENATVVGYVGRLLSKKGVDVLIQAFCEIYSECPDLYLAIVGGNDGGIHVDLMDQYKNKVRALKINDRVIFTGFQNDVRPWIKDFDFLVLPSIEPESFGRVLIEAMAFRVPSITTNLGGAVEVIRHEKNGLVVPPNNSSELSRAIKRLSQDVVLRREMADEGYRLLHEKFAASHLAEQLSNELYAVAGLSRDSHQKAS